MKAKENAAQQNEMDFPTVTATTNNIPSFIFLKYLANSGQLFSWKLTVYGMSSSSAIKFREMG